MIARRRSGPVAWGAQTLTVAVTLAAVGAWLFWAAGHYTVFDDEAFSCLRYTMPLGEMVRGLWNGVEPDPPLYYVLENLWVRVFGVGPLGLRSLSIILFLTGLVVMRRAAAAWFDARLGLIAFILCAIHPAHLFFGFAARWYSCMFLTVGLMMWATANMLRPPSGESRGKSGSSPPWLIWSVCAAAVCYTNYFGAIVVSLAWLVGAARMDDKRPWGRAAIGLIGLYAPWLPAFWHQATTFPQVGGGLSAYAATAARTTMALLAGDLAGPRAWWVWAPMATFVAALLVLLVRRWSEVWPLAIIVIGCFAAGVASRTMIDKYIMTFSGPACLLVAALLARKCSTALGNIRCGTAALGCDSQVRESLVRESVLSPPPQPLVRESLLAPTHAGIPSHELGATTSPNTSIRRLQQIAAFCVSLAWLGCGVNLVTERNWSSLRWLDPFESVIREWIADDSAPPPDVWVATHPSVGYYMACIFSNREVISRIRKRNHGNEARRELATQPIARTTKEQWAEAARPPQFDSPELGRVFNSPMSLCGLYFGVVPPTFLVLGTSEFADPTGEGLLRLSECQRYESYRQQEYLEDPDAEWKDRLDPAYKHARYRITVRLWRLKDGISGTTAPAGPTSAPMNRG